MNVQNPASLLWFLPIGAIIVALYLLRMRRRNVQVPAVFLWPEKTEEIRANALIQKLRFSWLLVFQILALLLAVFALARPQFKQKGLAGKVTVAILDASASMGANDVRPSRFDQAKASVADMVGSASPGDRLALIEAGPSPRVVFPLSNDPSVQRAGVDTVRRYDSEADMGEALRLASAIAASTDGAKIVVLSDGVFEPIQDFTPGKAEVVYRPFGKSSENMGVQALGVTEGPSGLTAYCGVRNFGLQPAKSGVSFFADGNVVESSTAVVAPGQVWGRTFRVPPGTKVLEAKLDQNDLLSADNYAVALTDRSASVRVLLVTKGDIFLERALSLDPRVTLDKTDRLPASQRADAGGEASYDIVVFDGVKSEPVKARGVMIFGEAGPDAPVKVSGEAKNPTFQSTENDPVVKGIEFENVYIEKMQRVQPVGGGRIVADAKEGPLVVVSNGKQKQVYVSFEPMESDFPLNYGFPILVGNSLDFLAGSESTDLLSVKVGQTFGVPALGEREAVLESDWGRVIVPARDDRILVRQAERVGRYKLTVGKSVRTVYATLRSTVESQVSPRQNLEVGSTKVAAVSQLSRFEDFWRLALLLALAVLGFEWWYFARRS